MSDIRFEKQTIILVEVMSGFMKDMALSLEASGYHVHRGLWREANERADTVRR